VENVGNELVIVNEMSIVSEGKDSCSNRGEYPPSTSFLKKGIKDITFIETLLGWK